MPPRKDPPRDDESDLTPEANLPDEADDDENDTSEGNVTRAKRDLLKLGLSQGHLTAEQIASLLPSAYMSPSEIETFFFTCATMGIKTPPR